jgi:hypothetical protein
MATNNNGHLLDSSGQVVVDFVWGNLPMQPNDQRPQNATGRLDITKDNHINAESGWSGYPLYLPNTTGADVSGQTDYVLVPSVLGLATANAKDALEDVSLVVTAATAATNTAAGITAIARTAGNATVTLTTGTGTNYPVGTSITIATGTSIPAELVGNWIVTANGATSVQFVSAGTTVLSASGLSNTSLTGTSGTIKTQSIAANAATTLPGAAVTITPWA